MEKRETDETMTEAIDSVAAAEEMKAVEATDAAWKAEEIKPTKPKCTQKKRQFAAVAGVFLIFLLVGSLCTAIYRKTGMFSNAESPSEAHGAWNERAQETLSESGLWQQLLIYRDMEPLKAAQVLTLMKALYRQTYGSDRLPYIFPAYRMDAGGKLFAELSENPERQVTKGEFAMLTDAFLLQSRQKIAGTSLAVSHGRWTADGLDDAAIDGDLTVADSTGVHEPMEREAGVDVAERDEIQNYLPGVSPSAPYAPSVYHLYHLGYLGNPERYGLFEAEKALTWGDVDAFFRRLNAPELPTEPFPELPSAVRLELTALLQYPELPTGCEVTSLAAVLAYLRYPVDKCELADTYLPKAEPGTVSYYDAFIGDPRTDGMYGCFAPVIVRCAKDYLTAQESTLSVTDMTGTPLRCLFTEIAMGTPVIVWATMYMMPSGVGETWVIEGKTVPWINNEHCLVLCGYDLEKNEVYTADPLRGNVTYDLELFEQRFNELFMQSVVIR